MLIIIQEMKQKHRDQISSLQREQEREINEQVLKQQELLMLNLKISNEFKDIEDERTKLVSENVRITKEIQTMKDKEVQKEKQKELDFMSLRNEHGAILEDEIKKAIRRERDLFSLLSFLALSINKSRSIIS